MSRWTATHLLTRRFRTRPTASLLVAALAVVTVLVAAVVPRLIAQQATAELAFQLAALAPTERALQGNAGFPEDWPSSPPPELGQLYGGLQSTFAQTRADLPRPLRTLVGAPRMVVQTPPFKAATAGTTAASVGATTAPASRTVGLRLTADPDYLARVRIVQGVAPATWTQSENEPPELTRSTPVDIAISVGAASAMKIGVGDLIGTGDDGAGAPQRLYRVSGLFQAVDASDQYWQQNSTLLPATVVVAEDRSEYLAASAFVDPLTVGRIGGTFGSARMQVYFPLATTGVAGADAEKLRSQLAATAVAGITLPSSGSIMPLQTHAAEAVQTAIDRGAVLAGLLALLAAAPLGVVLAVLVLGVQVVVRGRRPDLVLASARGASGWQLRGVMALEGALLSVPAAVVVMVLAAVLLPARVSSSALVLPVIVALAPPILFGGLAVTQDGPSPLGRVLASLRGVVEVAVVPLAVLSLVLLLRRGLAQATTAVGIDPLLSIAPLLLAVSVGILVLRGYPLPMRAARRAAARSRGLPAFVGSIRATRSPTIGLAGVLALVVGISVALFSAVLLTTFDAGIQRAASESVGADARVDAVALTTQQRSAAAAVPGVRAVAGIRYVGPLTVTKAPVNDSVTLLLADTAPLATLRALPTGLTAEVDGRVPIVVSSDLLAALGSRRTATIDDVPVRVLGSLPVDSQLGPQNDWFIADAAFASRFDTTFTPQVLLIRADPAALPGLRAPLEHAVDAGAATGTTVQTVPAATAARQSEPVVRGVRLGLILGALLSVLLCAIALVLSTVAAAGDRARSAGILRTLGMPRRALTTLIAWELVPVSVVALAAGAVLGVVLPWLITAAVDLRPFTGSAARPVPVLDPVLLAGALGGFVVVVLAAGLVAIAVGDRVSPGATLKMGAT